MSPSASRAGARRGRTAVAWLAASGTDFLAVAFDSDWRFPTAHSAEIARVISLARRPVVFEEVASPWGHDSFLLAVPRYHELVGRFLSGPVDAGGRETPGR